MGHKTKLYKSALKQISAVVDQEPSAIARYATICCILNETFDYYYWTGFYLIDKNKCEELVIGPYQGTLGCLRIPFGRGVCGLAAKTGKTHIVEDVDKFAGHIACDSKARSEIVVPVFDHLGEIAAVLDVDSTALAAFDGADKIGLEAICAQILTDAYV